MNGEVTLEKAMRHVRKLVKAKGHEDTLDKLDTKLWYAIIEVCEAGDVLKKEGVTSQSRYEIAEEIIDAIFYLLDAYGLLVRDAPMVDALPSEMFLYKLAKNYGRPARYGRPEEAKEN